MTDGAGDIGQVTVVRRTSGKGASKPTVISGLGSSGVQRSPLPGDFNSVRDRVRKMQGMSEIDKGIQALEAVAAAAASSRSSTVKLARNHGDDESRGIGTSTQGDDENPQDRRVLPSDPPPAPVRRRSSGRGMAALGVAGLRNTTWASVRLTGVSASASKDSGADCPSPEPRSLLRISSGISIASSPERSSGGGGADLSRDGSAIDNIAANPNGAVQATSTLSSPSRAASPKPFVFRKRNSIGAIFPAAKEEYDNSSSIGTSTTRKSPINSSSTSSTSSLPRTSSDRATPPAKSCGGLVISPRAKGFSAILWHDRSPPPGGESSSGGPERGSPDGRGKARGWWAKAADDESAKDEVDGNTSRTGSTPVEIRVENAELKLESLRLGNALCAAKENVVAAEARSKDLAKQAAMRVRQAEAQRLNAEEAAREAQAKAYSLIAAVQVLKSRSNLVGGGGGALGVSLTPGEVEAEVTAAYQGILQDMDMEKAALQQQLTDLQTENNMLRSRAVGSRTRPWYRTADSEEREASPLPTPRSFGRPKARGMSIARDGSGSDVSAHGEAGGDGCKSGSLKRGLEQLGRVLGTRVKLVQLEGLGEWAGSGRGGGFNGDPADRPATPALAEQLRIAEPSAEASRPVPKLRPAPDTFPWSKEFALWYGRVALVVAPGSGTEKDVPKTPAHSILLTDAALYVIETGSPVVGGGVGKAIGAGANGGCGTISETAAGSDSLCRLERHRVGSLSLPLETRALPNGDEVAVRSNAVVVRLKLSEAASTVAGGGTPNDAVGLELNDSGGGRGAPDASSAEERGFLWVSCETNEARGELVERLCQWHRCRPREDTSAATTSEAAAAAAAQEIAVPRAVATDAEEPTAKSETEVEGERAASRSERTIPEGGGDGAGVTDNGAAAKGYGDGDIEGEEEVLEVEQVLLQELLRDLGEERSLNVTALLLANAEALDIH